MASSVWKQSVHWMVSSMPSSPGSSRAPHGAQGVALRGTWRAGPAPTSWSPLSLVLSGMCRSVRADISFDCVFLSWTRKKEEKLDWMYQGPGGMVNRDEYLLGRPIDKYVFEKMEEKEAGCSSETGLLPGSIFAPSGANSLLDMASKIREDPLFIIRYWWRGFAFFFPSVAWLRSWFPLGFFCPVKGFVSIWFPWCWEGESFKGFLCRPHDKRWQVDQTRPDWPLNKNRS